MRDKEWWITSWRLDEVWRNTKGAGVVVAVIDSGVDTSAPELAGAVLPGADFTAADFHNPHPDSGGDGHVDYDTEQGHGTAMALFIAARGTGSGMIGVAPEAKILPVSIVTHNDSDASMVLGIRWAADHGAKVISISQASQSVAYPHDCQPDVGAAIRYAIDKDAVVVAGAGNHASGTPYYPASCPGVISVGAVDMHLKTWENSHRDAHVAVAAPGVDMHEVRADRRLWVSSGTSDATALTSATIALIRSKYPQLSARDVVTRMLATVRPSGAAGTRNDETGYGLVRPFQALTEDVPADAKNPVFDDLAATKPQPAPGATGAAGLDGATQAKSSTRGLPPGLIVFFAASGSVLVTIVVAVSVALRRRGRRRRAAQAARTWSAGAPPPPFGQAAPNSTAPWVQDR
ncbi:S8 family serine peptidase [Streptomyces sp. H10-C2]|uniref:S8 family serine peptidase n=1 Tax=unclassified Streptomyces TaxID=2593676 RepID=UPI0024B9D98A|nr:MULTISPECIES: S8 family serine peptidase [unclassified Streptomyces]MDJ0346839.1 S8 family serine peptidase [Streptomyces sp. PH10-H1]MDJ0375362.1 S8 family serine peptidase [Streptomyces sp. H10-C2]